MKILLIEDEVLVSKSIQQMFALERYDVGTADTGEAGLSLATQNAYDLIVLDLQLPDMSGIDILRTLRDADVHTPVLVLSGTADPDVKVRALKVGADDYLTKPFHFRELLLRIHNCLKRAQDLVDLPGEMRGVVRIGRARVDFERFSAEVDGVSHALTHKECAVLRLLASRVGKAVSRDEILDRAWSAEEFPTSRTVDNFIVRLRKLIEPDANEPRLIRSIRGVGYLLTEVLHD